MGKRQIIINLAQGKYAVKNQSGKCLGVAQEIDKRPEVRYSFTIRIIDHAYRSFDYRQTFSSGHNQYFHFKLKAPRFGSK
jgi:hypothetical protein